MNKPLLLSSFASSILLRLASHRAAFLRPSFVSVKAIPQQVKKMSSDSRPTGLIANKGIELLTFGTPNGHKVSILLEELKEAYGKDYVFQSINIMQNIQKEEWYTKVSPNGRIPTIIDHDRGGFAVSEGAAILQYLTRFYDPEHRFNFADPNEFSEAEQWIAWQHGGLGPMQGQANHFFRLAKERIPYPTQRFDKLTKSRYVGETERLMGVLDARLATREYLVGGKYSVADIANYSWVNVGYFAGVDVQKFKNVWAWCQRISARPAVQKGTAVPTQSQLVNDAFLKRLETEPEFKATNDKLQDLLKKAQEQYDYKFASP